MRSSHFSLPYRTPIPVGPYILCPENTKKSASSSATFTFLCATDCAPSISTGTPAECAFSIICFTGLTVPRVFDTWVTATSAVFSESRASSAFRSSSPLSKNGITLSLSPLRSHSSCQGTILEWCSISETIISCPAFSNSP